MQFKTLFFGLASAAMVAAAPADKREVLSGKVGPATGTISGVISPTGVEGGVNGNVGPSLSGAVTGGVSPTGISGALGGEAGVFSGTLSGGIYSTDIAGCIGGQDGTTSFSTCITIPFTFRPEPTHHA